MTDLDRPVVVELIEYARTPEVADRDRRPSSSGALLVADRPGLPSCGEICRFQHQCEAMSRGIRRARRRERIGCGFRGQVLACPDNTSCQEDRIRRDWVKGANWHRTDSWTRNVSQLSCNRFRRLSEHRHQSVLEEGESTRGCAKWFLKKLLRPDSGLMLLRRQRFGAEP